MSNLQTVTTDTGRAPLYETRAPVNENPRLTKLSDRLLFEAFIQHPVYRTAIVYNGQALNTKIVQQYWPFFPDDVHAFRENRTFTNWFTFALLHAELRSMRQTMILKAHKASSYHLLGIDKVAPMTEATDAASAPPNDFFRNRNNLEEIPMGANDMVIIPIPSYSITEKKRNFEDLANPAPLLNFNDFDCWTTIVPRSLNVWEMRFPESYGMTQFVSNAGTELYVVRFPYFATKLSFIETVMDKPVLSHFSSGGKYTLTEKDNEILSKIHTYNDF